MTSNYPNGFANGLTIRGLPLQASYPGEVFWVNNSTTLAKGAVGGSNGNPGTYQKPFATIDYAIGRCTAGRGDVIMVMPQHAETISEASAITADVANVAIVGLGSGQERPTLTFDTAATASIVVSAGSVAFKNFLILANFADIVTVFTLGAAPYFVLEDCYIAPNAGSVNFLSVITTGTTDQSVIGLTINNCEWNEPDTATLSFINLDCAVDALSITNSVFRLGVNTNDFPALVIGATGKAMTGIKVKDNFVFRQNDANPLLITTDATASNGEISGNYIRHADTAAELLVTTGTDFGFFNNYATAVDDASGFLVPAADS